MFQYAASFNFKGSINSFGVLKWKDEMRLVSRLFLARKSIQCLCSSRPNFSGWNTNHQLFTVRPGDRKIINTLSERMSSSKVPATSTSESNIIWIDMEMTGLDPAKDCILEVACLITNKDLEIIAEGPELVIHQPLERLNAMNEWCLTTHTKTGLFKASLESRITLEQAEDDLLKFVQQYTPPGKCPLAGNTVYMDKYFLLKYMPRFCEHLHYRILDVSSVKILAKSWYNLGPPDKKFTHRALDDIKESIQELTVYRDSIFRPTVSMSVKTTQKQ
ncbi:hypothetical protein GE061_019692 [Apolygus lucorum]|uniref:Probable oligoribonuclease n=1 Tax=Apolygus lucorum TaxID=248454 RepID=A0A6A4JHK8_APOLU|nr:hypothetical protein GE061_019692 [Apolygus lucorum]